MKIKILFFLIGLFIFSSAFVQADEVVKSVQFAGQWPYNSGKAIATDPTRELLFLGDGETINIIDYDLNLISTFRATDSGLIGSLFYSEQDTMLYVACRTDGFKMYDVSDLENPVQTGSYQPDSVEILGVYVDNYRAYLASGLDGLIILDITDSENPSLLSKSSLPGAFGFSYAIDVYASGTDAFAADIYNGIHYIDVSDPKNPSYIKGYTLAGAADLSVSGDYLYAALQGNGISIMDISTPDEATLSSSFLADGIETAVRVDDNFAFISYTNEGLRAVDITDKTTPVNESSWIYSESGGSSLAVLPGQNIIYMANYKFGLQKIDVADKANMHSLLSYDTPADAVAIDITNDYIYAVDSNVGNSPEKEGMRILRISVSGKAVQFYYTGFCATPGKASAIKVFGDYAYVADGDEGLQIINITDKTAPVISGNYGTTGTANGVFIDDNYAYVADEDQGLAIIDVSDKSLPKLSASLSLPDSANKVYVAGNYAYVADGDSGLQIIDITDKTAPEITGNYDTAGTANGVFIDGDYAYVADGSQGMSIIDIVDKTAPTLAAVYNTSGYAENVSISGNYAYVADGSNGLCTIDITIPALPVEETDWSYNSSGISTDVISGYLTDEEEAYAFIADGADGVIAVNLNVTNNSSTGQTSGNGSGGCFIHSAGY